MNLFKVNNTCPDCDLILIDDYWDIVEESPDGGFILDAFEAWVCPNRCGYYEKKHEQVM